MDTPLPPSSQASQIPVLLMRNRTALLGFILAAVRNHHDAEDILQEVCMIACEKAGQFEPGSNFMAWARAIAINRIHASRRKNRNLILDPTLLEGLSRGADILDREAERREARYEALKCCMQNLQAKQKKLMEGRYGEKLDIDALAERVGKNVEAVYKALLRIRMGLRECILRRLQAGEEA